MALVKDLNDDDWIGLALGWGLVGIVAFIASLFLSTDRHSQILMDWSHPALYVLIVFLVPYALTFVGFVGLYAWLIGDHLIPRRVTEPVREDLRARAQRDHPQPDPAVDQRR